MGLGTNLSGLLVGKKLIKSLRGEVHSQLLFFQEHFAPVLIELTAQNILENH